MKILFIENRYKTALWEQIGKALEANGHTIHWIVQNHLFTPSFGTVHKLTFPAGKVENKKQKANEELQKIIASNRGLNYFEIETDDFIYQYDAQIEEIINTIKPNVVFGESTAFHELLAIKSCKSQDILFLNPSSCRYPSRRFSFYKYDTLTPYKGSGEEFETEKAQQIVDNIVGRTVKPDYMKKIKPKFSQAAIISDKIRLIRGFYKGEKYNTPSPFVKRKLTKKSDERIAMWEKIAVDYTTVEAGFKVMYPLQMQPEANIDVWGYPHGNQVAVVRNIVSQLNPGEVLLIKPNPKSKYEISDDLLAFIQAEKGRVFALQHSSKMEDVLEITDLVVTVTGTVSIECIFANKPVVALGQGIQTNEKNCLRLSDFSELPSAIQQTKSSAFPTLTNTEKIEFLNKLVKTSYSGVICDGFLTKDELENPKNQQDLLNAFNAILKHVESTLQK